MWRGVDCFFLDFVYFSMCNVVNAFFFSMQKDGNEGSWRITSCATSSPNSKKNDDSTVPVTTFAEIGRHRKLRSYRTILSLSLNNYYFMTFSFITHIIIIINFRG